MKIKSNISINTFNTNFMLPLLNVLYHFRRGGRYIRTFFPSGTGRELGSLTPHIPRQARTPLWRLLSPVVSVPSGYSTVSLLFRMQVPELYNVHTFRENIDLLISWLINWSLSKWLIDWSSHWFIFLMIDKSSNWLIYWLIDWLIDQLICVLYHIGSISGI